MSNGTLKRQASNSSLAYAHDFLTSIGLDVHARTITVCALDKITGETTLQFFTHSEKQKLYDWIQSFESRRDSHQPGNFHQAYIPSFRGG